MLRCFVLFNINQCQDRKGWPIIIKLQRYYSETNLCWEFSYWENEVLESHKRETVIRQHSDHTLYCWMGKTLQNKLQMPSHKTVHLPCQSFLSLTSPLHSYLPPIFFPSLVCQPVSQSYCPFGCFLHHDIYYYYIWCELWLREIEQKKSKTHQRINQVTHKCLTEKDTGFMFYPARVSQGNRARVWPCWTEVAIETTECFKISIIIQYMSHMPDFNIDSDSVCMSLNTFQAWLGTYWITFL